MLLPLSNQTILHADDTGSGTPIVLLHGMAGSARYWEGLTDHLSQNLRVIAIDLMGFGQSPQSLGGYTVQEHVSSIRTTLLALSVLEPMIVVGHSMGALLAFSYAATFPDTVKQVILINPPFYKNQIEARSDIVNGKRWRKYAYFGVTSHLLCTTWCYWLRPISRRVAPLYLRKKPRHIAQDSVLHSWRSYSESLDNVIERQTIISDLATIKIPIKIIYGSQESPVVLANTEQLQGKFSNVSLQMLNGSHNLPLELPRQIKEIITEA